MLKEVFNGIKTIILIVYRGVKFIFMNFKRFVDSMKQMQDINKRNQFKDDRIDNLVKSSKLDD
jgi:hypothetical protein